MTKSNHSKNHTHIHIAGAQQNNLKNLTLDIPLGEMTVVTGLSGSGKSSLVFDTIYAEGQRRYVETFSPYARQFLDRMNRPKVDRIEGIPPAIAIEQNTTIRTSRSTVGTMTEINDHLKDLFSQHAHLFCPHCARVIVKQTPESIWESAIENLSPQSKLFISFEVSVPDSLTLEEARTALSAQGFTKIVSETRQQDKSTLFEVLADRFRLDKVERSRAIESIETALKKGHGTVIIKKEDNVLLGRFKEGLYCGHCQQNFGAPYPALFSFNSPLGACETCHGFGRTITIDERLVIPDETLTLEEGAVKPWNSPSFKECKEELLRYAPEAGVRTNVPFALLNAQEKHWLFEGADDWTGKWTKQWYGIYRFFDWLETKNYKMHVRVLLSRYRAYRNCPTCQGSRLKTPSLYWRYGSLEMRNEALKALKDTQEGVFKPLDTRLDDATYRSLPGLNFHEMMTLPLSALRRFFEAKLTQSINPAENLLLKEVLSRVQFLNEVGLGYLTLNRQSRTLSGGEVQRVNLTTALGSSLVNTLFVLDEPSVGLHPRDIDRVNRIMRALTARGNTLLVVEHDPQIMLAARNLLDLGPGAGENGGAIVYQGLCQEVLKKNTLTAQYLSGKKRISRVKPKTITEKTPRLVLNDINIHNLHHLDVSIPLGAFVVVCGVSGSGKSTLVGNALVPALSEKLGEKVNESIPVKKLTGASSLKTVIYVDQSPIGKTTRGNPVSYMGVFDVIRKLFAKQPLAQFRKMSYADFSFNTGNGRCPTCGGNGTERVEMQFLSDVYLPCPDCQGTRYRPETLEIKITLGNETLSIADVLALSVERALTLFEDYPTLVNALSILKTVGLGYLGLGQALTTLSGGERQRLKLAGHLLEAFKHPLNEAKKILFVFDEPTTGLHFKDVEQLVDVFDRLVMMGHSVLVIEHHLDVIKNADWILELGPDGGNNGGQLIFEGTPAAMRESETSITGRALSGWINAQDGKNQATFFDFESSESAHDLPSSEQIEINRANEHNLKNLSVKIPRNQLCVITGVSGSGKSTLAFDLIFAEGQRRYLESLNAYARSMVQPAPIPAVESIRGIPPTVAIEQRTSRGGLRSSVATMTEIYHFLRLLFVKLGTQYCPKCHIAVAPQTLEMMIAQLMKQFRNQSLMLLSPLVIARKGIYKEQAAWAHQAGFKTLRVDGKLVSTETFPVLARYREHTIELPIASLSITPENETLLREKLSLALKLGHDVMGVLPLETPDATPTYLSLKNACPHCGQSFPQSDPRLFSYNSKAGACPTCTGYGIITAALKKADPDYNLELKDSDETATVCPDCQGSRLNPVARSVFWKAHSIADITAMTVSSASEFFNTVQLTGREQQIASDALAEIKNRLTFLQKVGLGYLTLERSAPSLSGGEAQRIRLAAQLGTNLQGVCYVLDEPTIGLHTQDNAVLIEAMETLANKGNTLLVVEHDEETIRRAQHIIDIGPGAGIDGGSLIAQGSLKDIISAPKSLTGQFLENPIRHTFKPKRPVDDSTSYLRIKNIRKHNIDLAQVDIPLHRFVVLTGVSGSGKSTLARDVLLKNLESHLKKDANQAPWTDCETIEGLSGLERVLEVDQTPIGKTPRSCPATYVGFFDAIRKIFAATNEAKARGYSASRFSFNNVGGRCENCGGQGLRSIEMSFLPEIKVLCELCHGARFNRETLSVEWKDKSIGDVLKMQVNEACEFFSSMPSIANALTLLRDVGLGYLTLGQPSPTLSGGEAQRIKLVSELVKAHIDKPARQGKTPHTLYILDEPTVGLHMADVEKLINILHRLVDNGHSVIVIEHNLDLIAEADWVIDIGPEGGSGGGQLVGENSPAKIARLKTATGRALKAFIDQHKAR